MAGGKEGKGALAVVPVSKVDPEQFETLALKDHGCAQLDLWLAALAEGGATVSARRFELPVFAESGARTLATRLFVSSTERRDVWRPGDAYADLKPAKAVIDKALGLRAAQLCYSSYDFGAIHAAAGKVSAKDRALIADTARALQADWPHDLAPLRGGINFTGEATLLPEIDPALRTRFGLDGSVRVAGSVGKLPQGSSLPQGYRIEASAALSVAPLQLLGGRLTIALLRASVGVEGVGAEGLGAEGVGAEGEAANGATTPFTLALHGGIALDQQKLATSIEVNARSRQLTLIADAPDPIKAGALIKSLVPELGDKLSDAFGTMDKVVPGLQRLEVSTPLDGVEGARFALELGYSEAFPLLDLIRITPSLYITSTYSGGAFTFEAELTGRGEIGSGPQALAFETTLSLPEGVFRASLVEGSKVVLPADIAGKVEKVEGRESLRLIDLAISANTTTKDYSFSVITIGFLEYRIGKGSLLIGDVRFEIGKRGGGSVTALLEGTLVVGDVEADVSINIDNGLKGKVTIPRLPLGAIAADLLQIETPEELAAAEIKDFEVALTLGKETEFAFKAESDSEFTLAGLKAKLAKLDVSYAGKLTFEAEGQLRFDTTEVALKLDYAEGNWNVSVNATTRFDLGRALRPLAAEIGFEPPFKDGSLTVTSVDGALRLGTEGTRIALNFGFKTTDGEFRLTLVAARRPSGEKDGWDYSLTMGPATIDFRSLPVIGGAIGTAADAVAKSRDKGGDKGAGKGAGKTAVGLDALRLGVLSTLAEDDIAALFKSLPEKAFPPPTELAGKLSLTGTLRLLDYEKPILYPQPKEKTPAREAGEADGKASKPGKGEAPAKVETPAKLETPAKGAAGEKAPAAAPDDKPADHLNWLTIQRDCGPLHLAKLGYGVRKLGDSWEVSAALAGRISLSGVQLELMDAGVSVSLDALTAPRGRLKGMSLSFKRGSVSVEGGFLQMSETVYGGQLSIQLPKMSIGAVGLYGTYKTGPTSSATSLFLYGTLSFTGGAGIKLGAVTLTGLALGFGYNRRVVVPGIGAVADFPLVALAMKEGGADADKPSAGDMLATLETHLPFDEGQMFAALGLRFTIAETIDAFALAIAQFGKDVEFSLLGLARFEKTVGDQKFCRVELAIKMTLRPDEGVFLLQAELTANSWVLDPSCRLTGGFALGVWFAGARKGDFVLTIGGYHRAFKAPAHYPAVPRLGLNWAVTNELTLTGELYCALTPSHLMAGGRFEASFVQDRIKAWFVAAVDFLMRWAPLEYALDAGISIRIEADLSLFSINLSLDVQLSLWGPPFAGRVRVKLSVLSFEIAFGGTKAASAIRSWAQFGALFLDKASPHWPAIPTIGAPVEAPALCGAALVGGRLSQPGDRQPGGPWLVRGDELVLSVASVLPATTLVFGTVTGAVPPKGRSGRSLALAAPLALAATAGRHAAESAAFGIVPLAITTAQSTLTIAIVQDRAGGVTVPVDLAGWDSEPERQGMPAALWDREPPGTTPAAKMTGAYLTGLARLRPPAGQRRGAGTVVEIARHRARDLVFRDASARDPAVRAPAASHAPHDAAAPRPDPSDLGKTLEKLGFPIALGAGTRGREGAARAFHAPPMSRSWSEGA